MSDVLQMSVFPESFTHPVRSAEIIAVGTELTQGIITNSNARWICAQLVRLGVPVRFYATVADDLELAVETLRHAAGRTDLVIITGGLGPTRDDITRQVIADAAGVPLVLDEDLLALIDAFFLKRLGRKMADNNRRQAFLPEGAIGLHNPAGTAPGIAALVGSARVFAFPGVPRELHAMFGHLENFLEQLPGTPGTILIRKLNCFGTGESDVDRRIADLMDPDANPSVALTVSEGVITVRLTASAEDPAAAEALLAPCETEIRSRLAELIFSTDDVTLAETVAGALIDSRLTIALAESCTGGAVAGLLTDVPGVSASLIEGLVTYSNDSKTRRLDVPESLIAEHGAVSPEVATAMAEGLSKRTGADIALGITGIAGPTGGTPDKPVGLVFIALTSRLGTEVRRLQLPGDRSRVRNRAAAWALNMIRLLVGRLA